ncbi:hypothetical protein J3F83DRAFT_744095 [Trichoderma novae-zelandiae]
MEPLQPRPGLGFAGNFWLWLSVAAASRSSLPPPCRTEKAKRKRKRNRKRATGKHAMQLPQDQNFLIHLKRRRLAYASALLSSLRSVRSPQRVCFGSMNLAEIESAPIVNFAQQM